MRKAASLLVELPPEEAAAASPLITPASPFSGANPPAGPGTSGTRHVTLDDLPDLELPPEARLPSGLSEPRKPATAPARPVPKTVEQIVRDAPGPNLDEIRVDGHKLGPASALSPDGHLDFPAVYRAAQVPPSAYSAEQVLETLHALPDELPLATRRATVKSMLGTLGKSVGATAQTLVADASRKLAALQSYTDFLEKKTADFVTRSEQEMAGLEAQIEAKRAAVSKAKSELAKACDDCVAESKKLDEVLEFFSLDAGPSEYAPAVSPSAHAGEKRSN